MKRNHLNLSIIAPIVILFMSYFGGFAFADFGFAPPPADDMSRSFLNQIFGSLLDGGQDAYGASIRSFNAGILIIGGILAAYTIFSGTLGTAHDGEMLGKKFSSVWIPIRYTLGTALVLPVLSGGYCIMQGIVMWLIMQGVSLANGVWQEFMKNPPALSIVSSSKPSDALLKFVENSYLLNVCIAGNQKLREGASYSVSDVAYNLFFEDNSKKWEYKTKDKIKFASGYDKALDKRANQYVLFGIDQGYIASMNCGEIHYMEAKKDDNSSRNNTISDSTVNTNYTIPGFKDLGSVFKSPDYASVMIEHYNQIDNVIKETNEMAVGNIGKKDIDPIAEYTKLYLIAEKYHNAIKAKAKEVNDANTIKDASTKQGWFMSGAWITQIILQQNKLNTVLNATPSASKINFRSERKSKMEEFTKLVTPALKVISNNNDYANSFLTKALEEKEKEGQSNEKSNISTNGDIGVYLAKFVSGIDLLSIKEDTRHPIIIMSTVGNSIITSIMQASVFIFVAAVGASVWAGFSSMFISFYGTFAIPIAGFIGVGATLAYLIPNLPFLLWIGIIIGWSVMCVEAIIVAPLWAVMHLHPNGDDVTGKGGSGYMLVLGLTLRPVLIIFGLISAITLSGLFGQLVNVIFLDSFMLNQGDGGLGFFSALFSAGLYAAIMMMVIKQTFNLMHVIPDQILRWIGGGKEQLGQYAGASMEGMAKASAIGASAATLATGSSIAGGMKGLSEEFRKADDHKGKIKEEKNKLSQSQMAEDEAEREKEDIASSNNKRLMEDAWMDMDPAELEALGDVGEYASLGQMQERMQQTEIREGRDPESFEKHKEAIRSKSKEE